MRGSIVKRGKTYTYVLSLGRDDDGRSARSGSVDSAPRRTPRSRSPRSSTESTPGRSSTPAS